VLLKCDFVKNRHPKLIHSFKGWPGVAVKIQRVAPAVAQLQHKNNSFNG